MSVDDLIHLNDALKLEKQTLYQIIRDFLPYSDYCGNNLMIPEKMTEWCTYLQCDGTTCRSEIVALVNAKHIVPQQINVDCNANTTLDPILRYNTSCFDAYFCTPMWASKDFHYVLGIICLILAIMSLFSSLIFVFAFKKEFGKKHTPSLLLMTQSICDMFLIIITIGGLLSIYTYNHKLSEQLKLYSSIHIYIVVYILPFACFFESLSLWIIILLIFDRYNYLAYGAHSKNLLTKKICFSFLFGMSLMLIAMASLRIFQYDIVALYPNSRYRKLIESNLGKDLTYNNLIQFWLKMPFESILPLSLIFIIIVMVIHKLVYSGATHNIRNSYVGIQEFLLTKSILIMCCLLLIVKFPKLLFHILKYEIGMEFNASIKFELICHLLDHIYMFIKTCLIYKYACPVFTKWLQNKVCFDSDYNWEEYVGNVRSTIDEYKSSDYSFENNCKKSIFIDPTVDKETIV